MRSRIGSLRRRRQQQTPGRQARSFAPLLEQLEGRCLLSVNTSTHVAGPNINASNLSDKRAYIINQEAFGPPRMIRALFGYDF